MYTPEAYFIARYIGDAPYIILECFLYSFIYWFVGFNPYDHSSHYGYFFWLLIVLRYCGVAITHFFGTAIAAPDFAATLEITFFHVMLAFTGFLIPGPQIPQWWVWLYDVSFIRYVLNTAVYFEFINEYFECDDVTSPYTIYASDYDGQCPIIRYDTFQGQSTVVKCQISCGYDIFSEFGVNPETSQVIQNFGILHCFAIFFFILAYLALRFINHVKR
jgi:ABC-type multidrug transport system permease subunit